MRHDQRWSLKEVKLDLPYAVFRDYVEPSAMPMVAGVAVPQCALPQLVIDIRHPQGKHPLNSTGRGDPEVVD